MVADGVDADGEAGGVGAFDQPVEVALGEHHRAQPAAESARSVGLEEGAELPMMPSTRP